MTYLELLEVLRQETAFSDKVLTNVTNLPTDLKRLADWINVAWREIQLSEDDWYFMRAEDNSLTTTAQLITLPVDCAVPYSVVLQDGTNLYECTLVDRAEFDELYKLTNFTSGLPRACCVVGSQLRFNAIPDKTYTVRLIYRTIPQQLVLAADTPTMPAHYHRLIIYRALEHYGRWENAGDIVVSAQINYAQLYHDLARYQLPTLSFPDPVGGSNVI